MIKRPLYFVVGANFGALFDCKEKALYEIPCGLDCIGLIYSMKT